MNRVVWIGVFVLLAGAVVTATTAAPILPADNISEDVSLSPADGPNGKYADYRNDEIVIDLTATNPDIDGEGIVADGTTRIDNVFIIRYNGTRFADVWLTHGSDDVTFYADGQPIENESSSVRLGPNQTTRVGLRLNASGETTDGIINDVTVHATVAEPEDVEEDDSQVETGDASTGSTSGPAVALREPAPTTRTVTIVGISDGTPITLDLNTMPICRESSAITLDEAVLTSGSAGTLDLEFEAMQPQRGLGPFTESLCTVQATERQASQAVDGGTLRFSVDRDALAEWNTSAEELIALRTSDGETTELPLRIVNRTGERVHFAVETPGFSQFTIAAGRPNVDVTAAELTQTSVAPNETITVTGEILNDGRANTTEPVTVMLNDSPVATQSVTLASGESQRVSIPITPQAEGQYVVQLDNTTAGTIDVTSTGSGPAEGGTAPTDSEPTREPAGLGLGGILVLIGALVATLTGLAGVRRWSR